MPEHIASCPLCGAKKSTLFDRRQFRGQEIINRLCRNCGLVFLSPRMTELEASAFYADQYRLLQEGAVDPTQRNIAVQKARAASLSDFIKPLVPLVSRHLDVGCSLGILLQRIQAEYSNEAVGIEPDQVHRGKAIADNLVVYSSMEELKEVGEPRFDLVTMSHVLEHLPDPVGYLTNLREQVLETGGLLLVEVPNLYAHDCFEVAHLCSFSFHTLQEVLYKSGFRIIQSKIHGHPSSAIFPLFLTVLCRPVQSPVTRAIRRERGVYLKRQWGMLKRRILSRLFLARAWLVQG